MVINPTVIQSFLYNYIGEKMRTETINIQVSQAYADFLNDLPLPLDLQEMRTLKEKKYDELRALLYKEMGGQVLKTLMQVQEEIGLGEGIFDAVYANFWDLYTLHSVVEAFSPKKLQ